jgi:hypothetical protein
VRAFGRPRATVARLLPAKGRVQAVQRIGRRRARRQRSAHSRPAASAAPSAAAPVAEGGA